MKTNHTKEQIQAAIDAACEASQEAHINTIRSTLNWSEQAPARLHLLKSALASLPEPPPAEIPWIEWHGGTCPLKDEEVEEWEYKVRSGQVYNWNPPSDRFWKHDGCPTNIIAYRVTKWREGFGPQAEVDWKAKYEEVVKERDELRLSEYLYKRVTDALGIEKDIIGHVKKIEARAEKTEAELALVTLDYYKCRRERSELLNQRDQLLAREGQPASQPDTDEGSDEVADTSWLEELPRLRRQMDDAITQLNLDGTTPENLAMQINKKIMERDDIHMKTIARAEKAEAKLARPLAPAEPVKPWTPAVGDVVMLKSGGPKMVVISIREADGARFCGWFDTRGHTKTAHFDLVTIQPA